jgi:hypothetical protein
LTTKENSPNESSVKSALAKKGSRISRARRKNIEDYIWYLQEELRLTDWFVVLHDDRPDDEVTARVNTRRTQRVANLTLGDRFFNDDDVPDDLRMQVLVHELLHLHFEMAWHFAQDVFEAELSHISQGQAVETFRCNMELGIDQLAYALVDLIRRPFKLDG